MTDKQIIIDYKTLCENYSKEVGCYNTFDGRCNKEQCFTYKLLQLLQDKEQECEELKERLESFQKDYSKLYQVVENKGYIKELDQLKAQLLDQEAETLKAGGIIYALKQTLPR